jgi:diadenosine tetraphosphate (Ap4A) HIT family hydrolase
VAAVSGHCGIIAEHRYSGNNDARWRNQLIVGDHVGQGHRSSGLAGEGSISAGECRSCAIWLWVSEEGVRSQDAYVAEDVDEKVVVVSSPVFAGLVVIPRRHISGLEELSVVDRAQVLGAQRRATRSVEERNPGMTTKVVVMNDPPASEGHACYHVLPSDHVDPKDSPSTPL